MITDALASGGNRTPRKQPQFRDDPRWAQVTAPAGSALWLEYHRGEMQNAVRVERNTIISFTSTMATFIEHEGWKVLTNEDGKTFEDFRHFALSKQPHGLGCDEQQFAAMIRNAQIRVPASRDY